MLTRRAFHSRLLASVAALNLPRAAFAGSASEPNRLYLNRLTFGANADSLAEIADLGPAQWLDRQLAMPASDPDLDARLQSARLRIAYEAESDENGNSWPALDELRPLAALAADPADLVRLVDWGLGMSYLERIRPASEVLAAALIRTVHAPAQLREVMTQFWHDHFNVNSQKNEFCAVFFASHDAVLRENALGNFRVLLGEVAKSPAMLYYLNNNDSRASPAKENYARELLELHTMGAKAYLNEFYTSWREVPGAEEGAATGYIDQDVYEVARAFTGWTVGDGSYVSEGAETPRTGRFHYVEAWHDPYQKRILGVEFAPNRAAMADGEQVLDMLAVHPATARFVCEKIARRLLSDAPDPALVADLAAVFLDHSGSPDQIAQVVRALVLHPGFAATPPAKLRRPFEVMAALYRATGAEVTGTENSFQWQLMRAGWHQHEYGPPTGHPDVMGQWTGASSLNRVVDLCLIAHEPWFGCVTLDLAARIEGDTLQAVAARWAGRIGHDGAGLAAMMGIDPDAPAAALNDEELWGVAAGAIALAAVTPDFLLR
jgi:uncharacterized protein (DUF1800 family)